MLKLIANSCCQSGNQIHANVVPSATAGGDDDDNDDDKENNDDIQHADDHSDNCEMF